MIELTHLHPHQVFLRREAIAHGYDDDDLSASLRAGHIARVRRGAYTTASLWKSADEYERHRLRCHAVLLTHDNRVVLSHTSAAVMHGLAVWAANLNRVHLTRLDRRSTRVVHDVAYHRGEVPERHLMTLDSGAQLTTPARAAVEHASITSVEGGLVTVDSFLHLHRQRDLSQVQDVQNFRANWPGNQRLQITLRLARPGSESVGESRMRFLFWEYHLPEPELQFAVHDQYGQLIGRSDFAWQRRRLLGEFDGKVKYEKYLRPGESVTDAVVREKQREDRMREQTGYALIRFDWSDLHHRERTAARIRRALDSP